jgi:hypothetical protein
MNKTHTDAAQAWEARRSKLIALRRKTTFRSPEWVKLTKLTAFATRHAEYHWQRAF